jgi:PAS domain S-box-containing protein
VPASQRNLDTTIISELRIILKDTGVGVWSFDSAHREFTLDDTCREIFDIQPGDNFGPALVAARIHADDIEGYWRATREAVDGDGEHVSDYRVVHRDGSIRFVSSRGRVKPHLPGEPVVINGVLIDMTQRKHLEQRLRDAERLTQHLAESMPGLFVYADKDLIVRFVNDRCAEFLRRPIESIVDCHLSKVFSPAYYAVRKPYYERVLAGETVMVEVPQHAPGGAVRWYAMTYQPDRAADGTIRGFITLGFDISERRHAEQALEEKTRELARSNHDLEQFAYVASHDLKAPLRAIESLVDWLREDLAGYTGGDVQEHLGLLKNRAGRLSQLLDDLLAYSRAGRKVGDISRIDSRQLVEDLMTLLAAPATMTLHADSSLPTLAAYHAPLEQVLRNLINNAIKHHPTASGHVRVYAETRDSDYMFAVEDDGTGIAPEFSEKVFQMFQTLKPRDDVEGSGMGLAIVKRIVEWQGGRIWFHAGPNGKGTVFKFTWKKLAPESSGASPADDPHANARKNSAG